MRITLDKSTYAHQIRLWERDYNPQKSVCITHRGKGVSAKRGHSLAVIAGGRA